MSLIVRIGRRVPKHWFKRTAGKLGGLISFQENLWLMIVQSMSLGRKKCNRSGKGEWVTIKKSESEDLHYDIEWQIHIIRGDERFEQEEFNDAMKLYDPLGKIVKKEFPVSGGLGKVFKTKILTPEKLKEAYREGYGTMTEKNISNKLLEMGILTHVEWTKDFDTRDLTQKPDF